MYIFKTGENVLFVMNQNMSLTGVIEKYYKGEQNFSFQDIKEILYLNSPIINEESNQANSFEEFQVQNLLALHKITENYHVDSDKSMNVNDSYTTKKIGQLLQYYNDGLKEAISHQYLTQTPGAHLDLANNNYDVMYSHLMNN